MSLLCAELALASLDDAAMDTAPLDDALPPSLRGGWGAPVDALVKRFFPAIAPQSTAEGSVMVVCASLDVASLDGTFSWAAAVAATAHGVADAGGMTMAREVLSDRSRGGDGGVRGRPWWARLSLLGEWDLYHWQSMHMADQCHMTVTWSRAQPLCKLALSSYELCVNLTRLIKPLLPCSTPHY